MKSRTARALVVTGAAAGALALGISAANASTVWTVKAGTAHGTVSYTAKTSKITLKDTSSAAAPATVCSGGGTSVGTVVTGKHVNPVATVAGPKATFKGCAAGPLTLTVHGLNTWKLNATGYSNGKVTGKLAGIYAKNTTNTTCAFAVKGSVPFTYTNATHVLVLNGGGLTVANQSGNCFSLINNGDHASLSATYKLSKPITFTK